MGQIINLFSNLICTDTIKIILIVIQALILITILFYTIVTKNLMKENFKIRILQEKINRLTYFKESCHISNFQKELERDGMFYGGMIVMMNDEQKTEMFNEIEKDFEEEFKMMKGK